MCHDDVMNDASHASAAFSLTTSWGTALIFGHGRFITAIEPPLPDTLQRDVSAHVSVTADALSAAAPPAVRELGDRLLEYFDRDARVPLVTAAELETWFDALGIGGFRRRAALELAAIPAGVTITYGELAALAGRPGAARAVGSMCSRNPLPVVVPCHRVLHAGARGVDVGTYGAGTGTDYKRRLLEHEGWTGHGTRSSNATSATNA